MPELQDVTPDGLYTPEVGRWSLDKYRLVGMYDALFAKGMKHRWDCRVYLDLFCGPGRARIRGTTRVVETSPLRALRIPDPFDKYIFCDECPKAIDALRQRVVCDFPAIDVVYIVGDCNRLVGEIIAQIHKVSRTRKVLSFCFLDPYGISTLKLSTIRALSRFRMDFLILLALAMDANRFQSRYVLETNQAVDEFLDDSSWRDKWHGLRLQRTDFRRFLAQQFAAQMTTLDYLRTGMETMKEIRSDEKNLPLYHLAFFSKHERGYEFWEQVRKYSTDQRGLFD